MKKSFLRLQLALGVTVSLASFATAEQNGFEQAFEEWTDADASRTIKFDVQTAAYRGNEPMEEMPAPKPPAAGEMGAKSAESEKKGSSHGGCDEDYQGDHSNSTSHQGCCSADHDDCGSSCDCMGSGCLSECYCTGCTSDWYRGDYAIDCCSGSCSSECAGEGCPSDCDACGYDDDCGDCLGNEPCGGMYYAEVHNMFMRAHVNSEVVGKLREKYEYSPRVVLGYEAPSGVGARMRYWNYTRTTSTVDDNSSLRFDFDVIDVEGTTRFTSQRADLLLSGGFRWADMAIDEDDGNKVDAEMPGITFAADVRAGICGNCSSQWSGVCGARWSMLGGDWEGDANNNFIEETFDDNLNTQEIYGGFEYRSHHQGGDLYARFVFEVQNWHSDALGANADTDSFSFVGPGIHAGASF